MTTIRLGDAFRAGLLRGIQAPQEPAAEPAGMPQEARAEPPATLDPSPPARGSRGAAVAAELCGLADRMQPQIESKLNPAIAQQNLTRRRAAIAASMASDGLVLQRVQQALRGLAALHEAGRCPELLAGLTSRAAVQDVLQGWAKPRLDLPEGRRLRKAGIGTDEQLAEARRLLERLTQGESPEQRERRRIQELERELLGCKIPGFFPTPRPVIEQMLELADLGESHQCILEPSAGKGDILDALAESPHAQEWCVHAFEINPTLRKILCAKGYPESGSTPRFGYSATSGVLYVQPDFLAVTPTNVAMYSRVLMNPPFEQGQDIAHIQHAFGFLKPGGRLVSVCSEGPFFRQDLKCREFRSWLCSVPAETHSVPAGAFQGRDSFRQTGVACRLIVIDKPEDAGDPTPWPTPSRRFCTRSSPRRSRRARA